MKALYFHLLNIENKRKNIKMKIHKSKKVQIKVDNISTKLFPKNISRNKIAP